MSGVEFVVGGSGSDRLTVTTTRDVQQGRLVVMVLMRSVCLPHIIRQDGFQLIGRQNLSSMWWAVHKVLTGDCDD